jgi:predicted permease
LALATIPSCIDIRQWVLYAIRMFEIFLQSSSTTLLSMLKIFLVMLAAGLLVRRRVLTPNHIKGLTAATVDVFLPCMTFYSILANLIPGAFNIWWVLPLSAGVMMLGGIGLAALFFRRELPEKRNMLPMSGIHNAAYLILPLGAVLFPRQFDQFSLYIFLFLTGQTPIIWSIGKYMTTASADTRFQWKDALTPPLISALFALALVFTGFRDLVMPQGQILTNSAAGKFMDVVLASIKLLGDATVPLALFILGGVLGSIRIRLDNIKWDVIRVIVIKFILLPVITFLVVLATGLGKHYPLLATFFIIQSSAPPAIVIILQVSRYGGDEQKLGSMLLVTYLVCLFALPFWLALWSGMGG